MSSLADSLVASSSRIIGLKMRADLTARRQLYQGRAYWVVKEPVGLRYFRFQEEEFAVLNMLKGEVTLEEVKDRFEEEFAPHKITYQDLQHFIGTLHRSGLVVSDASGQGKQLKKRADERNRKETMSKFSNILSIRFKGIDPQNILNFIYPFTRWMFTTPALIFFSLLALSALALLGVNFDIFSSRLPAFDKFFGPKNWGYLAIVLGVTKVIHEFGHGLLCHHFGGECHEMGVMFLVLTPCLYCNVSDSWMLPSKWQRAAIGAGGIYFELIMASIATFVWWFSEPGMLNHLALRVMFICSVSTVLFNGNPLLRFDGYYILADIMEIPNLRQKSSKILQNKVAEVCLGLEMPEDPFLPQSNQIMFGLYTIAAVAYRWFIFFSIMFFLNQVFEPYGLKIIGQLLAVMGLYGLIVMPAWQGAKFLHVPGRMDQVKWPRLYATLGILALIIVGVLFLPIPKQVACAFQLVPRDSSNVTVPDPGGKLEVLNIKPGMKVSKDDVIAKLKNVELDLELHDLYGAIKSLEKEIAILERNGDRDGRISLMKTQLEGRKSIFESRKRARDSLVIRAPVEGTVMSPPLRPEKTPPMGQLPQWSGSPMDERNEGLHLQKGDMLCTLGVPGEYEAELAVDQADMNFIKEGMDVKMVLESLTYEQIEGTISQISIRDMQVAPASLGNQAGGTLATRTDASGVERPLSATYKVSVLIDDQRDLYRTAYRGQARIKAGTQTIGASLWQYITRTFHFHM